MRLLHGDRLQEMCAEILDVTHDVIMAFPEIPDYRQEQTDMETRIKEIREKQKQEEENEWEYGNNNRREQDL